MRAACLIAVSLILLGGDEREDARAMEGTWLPTSAELAGKPFPDKILQTMKLTMASGKYTVTVGEKSDQGTVKLDPAKKPKAMDITGTDGPNKGKTILAIYELTKDTLKVCYDLGGQGRPTEFKSTPETKHFLVTYRREKP